MSGAVRSKTQNLGLALLNFAFPNWGDDANRNMQLIDVAFSILGLSISGSWSTLTLYTAGQLLVDTDTNEVYRVIVTHTSLASGTFAESRALHPEYWQKVEINFSIRGVWSPATAYLIGDIVYDPTQYLIAVCLTPHVSGATLRGDQALGKWAFIVDMKAAVDAANASAAAAAASASIASGVVSGNIGPAIAGAPAKTALVAADRIAIANSENAFALGYTTWTNVVAVITTALSGVYAALVHTHPQSDITGLVAALALLAPKANPTITGTMNAAIANFSGAVAFSSTVALAADPTTALQAVTKQYVDGLLANIGKRQTVRAATTAAIVISTALNNGDTIDGVVLVTGDYVMVKDQGGPEQNGVYVVGVTPVRATEFDTYNEHAGALIAIQEGTVNADTVFLCTSNVGGTLNTTGITFSKFVVSGELIAANNLSDIPNKPTAFDNIKQSATTTYVGASELATAAELQAGTDTVRTLTPDAALSASAWFGLTDGATVTINHQNGPNQKLTLGGNRTIASPTNQRVGWPLNLWLVQDAGGSRVPTFASDFDFGDYGTPVLSTAVSSADLLTFICLSSGKLAFLGIRKRVD